MVILVVHAKIRKQSGSKLTNWLGSVFKSKRAAKAKAEVEAADGAAKADGAAEAADGAAKAEQKQKQKQKQK